MGALAIWPRTLLDLAVTAFREHPELRFRWLPPAALTFIAVFFGSQYVRSPLYLAFYVFMTLRLPSWLEQAVHASF